MSDKADIRELAVAAWRLEKWLDNLVAERKMAAKSALRCIKKYIAACGVEVKDPIGSKFDPGLAVEVINNEDPDADEEDLIITETLAPYIYQNGELIQHARVIIGIAVKEAKANIAIEVEALKLNNHMTAKNTVAVSPNRETNSGDISVPEEERQIDADDLERMLRYAKVL